MDHSVGSQSHGGCVFRAAETVPAGQTLSSTVRSTVLYYERTNHEKFFRDYEVYQNEYHLRPYYLMAGSAGEVVSAAATVL
jgi:hypothetical protein